MADPVVMNSTQKVHGTISGFIDANGDPATVDSAPRWTSSDESVFKVIVSADGMDVDVVAEDMPVDAPMKNAILALNADEGGVTGAITMTFEVVISSVASALAVGANIVFGAPEAK